MMSVLATPPSTLESASIAPAIVTSAWLRTMLDEVRIVDTRDANRHKSKHIPGARCFPVDHLLVDDSRQASLVTLASALQTVLAKRGIHPEDHVVLVDDQDASAALGALLCELAGMQKVSMLSGGINTWQILDGDIVTGFEPHQDNNTSLLEAWEKVPTNLSFVASFEDLVEAANQNTAYILDVRSQLEHEGIIGPPCCRKRGSIPQAQHLEWSSLHDLAGKPLLSDQVRMRVGMLGINERDPIIVTSHSGHRAATAARVLRVSGITNVRVSLGSWHEWALRQTADADRI